MITKEQYEQFDSAYKTWFASKGNDSKKNQMLKQMREVYKLHLWQKLKDMYKKPITVGYCFFFFLKKS